MLTGLVLKDLSFRTYSWCCFLKTWKASAQGFDFFVVKHGSEFPEMITDIIEMSDLKYHTDA